MVGTVNESCQACYAISTISKSSGKLWPEDGNQVPELPVIDSANTGILLEELKR